MPNKTLTVRVKTEVTGAERLAGLGTNLRNVGRNLSVGVTLPLIAAGGAMIGLAREAEETDAKLASVFDSMSANAFTSIEALHEHAEALAEATTFDDDAVKDAQAMLLTFGEITGDTFTAATDAAADLAVFFETDMEDAALTLGKALQNPIDGLTRLGRQGIIFSDEQRELVRTLQEAGDTAGAQAIILAEVQRQVGQVAEDLAATNSGQTAQDMNRLGEAGEKIGTLLLPVLAQLADILGAVAGWINSLDPSTSQLVVTVLALAAAVGPVVFILGSLVTALGAVGSTFGALSALLLLNPFVALIAAVVALAALIALNWDNIVLTFQNAWRAIVNVTVQLSKEIQRIWKEILGFFGSVGTGIAKIGASIWKPFATGFQAAIGAIKGVWNAFARFWNGLQIGVPAVDVPFVGRVGGFTIGLPDLPTFAQGGIVTQATLGILGEKGPEAVIPLDKLNMGDTFVTNNFYLRWDGEPPKGRSEEEIIGNLQRLSPLVGNALVGGS